MVVDYVFLKFPRLRAKYDTSSVIWQSLPTDADLDARHKAEQVRRNYPKYFLNLLMDCTVYIYI